MASNGHLLMIQEAEQFAFFHGSLSEKEVEKLFRPYMKERGSYILRKSNTDQHALTVSVVNTKRHIYHFRVAYQMEDYVVGGVSHFPALHDVFIYYRTHSVPGHEDDNLFLSHPILILTNRNSSLIRSNSDEERRKLSIREHLRRSLRLSQSPNRNSNATEKRESFRRDTLRDTVEDRAPMPVPRQPIYSSDKHYYSVAKPNEVDQLQSILNLCKDIDDYQTKSKQKCSCGLYMSESELIHGWMVHRDTEGHDARGNLFFLDTNNSISSWELPKNISREIHENHPDMWKRLKRLQRKHNV